MTEKEVYQVAIAALLHDVGKFKQRAYGGDDSFLKQRDMEGILLPKQKGELYSHRHALWTYDFFIEDLLPIVSKAKKIPDLNLNEIALMAAKHHNSANESDDCKIITEADRISSAGDRKEDNSHYDRKDYLKRRLKPVFQKVTTEDNQKNNGLYVVDLKPLSPETIFPEKIQSEDTLLTDKYKKLWDSFLKELPSIFITENYSVFLQLLSALYEKYTWCIPSATNDKYQDISLYDHSLTTMTFAVSLKYFKNSGEKFDNDKPFRIFAADSSGIQSYIFQNDTKSFKGNSKIIRARSFFISAVSEAYYLSLCDYIGVIPYVQFMNAGGKFIALLPNTKEVVDKTAEFIKETNDWMYKHFHGAFTINATNDISVGFSDLVNTDGESAFSKLTHLINYELEKAKSRKLPTQVLESPVIKLSFTPGKELCPACDIREESKEIIIKNKKITFCTVCAGLFENGTLLTKSKYFVFMKNSNEKYNYPFFAGKQTIGLVFSENIPESYQGVLKVYGLNNEDVSSVPSYPLNSYVGRSNENDVLNFEEIGNSAFNESDTEKGKNHGSPFLAFIKSDVDSLGNIFVDGFRYKENNSYVNDMSVSRYVSMSRSLNYFFNTYMRHFLNTRFPDFYTVLSGGDDLFIISPWNKAMDFIVEMRSNFKKFVCDNPDIHFSTGIEITKHNFPMNKATHKAEQHLEKAKCVDGKDAVVFFNPMKYEVLEELHNKSRELIKKIKNDEISTAFLYRLLTYTRMAKDLKSGSKDSISNIRYIAQFKYDIARNFMEKKKNEQVVFINTLFEKYIKEKPEMLETIIKVSLYETRVRTMKIKEDKE